MRFGRDKFGDSLPGRSLNGAYDSRGARAHQRVSAAESSRSRVADSVQQDTLKPPRAAGWGKVEHLGHGLHLSGGLEPTLPGEYCDVAR